VKINLNLIDDERDNQQAYSATKMHSKNGKFTFDANIIQSLKRLPQMESISEYSGNSKVNFTKKVVHHM